MVFLCDQELVVVVIPVVWRELYAYPQKHTIRRRRITPIILTLLSFLPSLSLSLLYHTKPTQPTYPPNQ